MGLLYLYLYYLLFRWIYFTIADVSFIYLFFYLDLPSLSAMSHFPHFPAKPNAV